MKYAITTASVALTILASPAVADPLASSSSVQVGATNGANTAKAETKNDPEIVIVTGERVKRSLLDTSSSVTVLNNRGVQNRSQQSLLESLAGIPNLVIAEGEGLPAIRGQQSNALGNSAAGALQTGSEQRALLVVDDFSRVATFSNTAFNSLFDVDQIEVYRGPQSTLRGRNAIAGAIVVTTREPEFIFGGRVLAEVNNDDVAGTGYRIAGAVSLPVIADKLAVRLSVERNVDRDSISALLPDEYTGTASFDDARRVEGTRANVKIRLEPREGTRLDLLGNYAFAIVPLTRNTAAGPASGAPFKGRVFAFAGDWRVLDTEAYLIGAKFSQKIGPGEFRLLVGYGDEVIVTNIPRNASFVTFEPSSDDTLTTEALYSFKTGKLEGLAGVSYVRRTTDTNAAVFETFKLIIDAVSDTYAAYADFRYKLSEDLEVNLGGRYLTTSQTRSFAFGAPIIVDEKISDTVFLPQLGLSYNLSETQRLSASLRKGFLDGGRGPNLTLGTTYKFDPETVWAAEATYRHQSRNGRASLAVTGFYNGYRDQQFFVDLPTDPVSAEVRNQPRSRSFGLEIEGRLRLDQRLTISGGIGLLDTEVTKSEGVDVKDGNNFGFSPPVTINLGVEWRPIERLSFDGRVSYAGKYFTDVVNERAAVGGDYANVDFGVAYDFGRVEVRAFVQNAFDELAFISRAGDENARLTRPRTIGLTLTSNF